MKKLYSVEVSKEVWVTADNEIQACEIASKVVNEDGAQWLATSYLVEKDSAIPDEVRESLVWGTEKDLTVIDAFYGKESSSPIEYNTDYKNKLHDLLNILKGR